MAANASLRTRARGYARRALERWRGQLADVENTPGLGLLCVLGATTGALAGGVILLLYGAIQAIRLPLFAVFDNHGDTFVSADLAFRIAVPVIGALILGLLVEWWFKSLENGIVHVIERLMYYQGLLPLRAALVDLAATAIAIATGQSVGREGTAVHTGAFTGSWLARRLALPNNSVRTLVGCGVAAGIAASFNTPLAGVIFAMEVVMMEYTIAGFAPIILAAVTGSLVTLELPNLHPQLTGAADHFHALELPAMTLMGLLLGVIGGGFTRVAGAFAPKLANVRISLRLALAGLVTGLLAIVFPQIMGLGFETVNHALAGEFLIGMALGIGAAKLVATLFAVAAGMPGGIILPMFVTGAGLGSAWGSLVGAELNLPVSGPGLYALLGIGAMMAAVLQAPLSALVAILELSGQTAMVLPGMLVIIAALVVSRRVAVSDSIFRLLLRRRGLDYRNDPISQYLRRASVLTTMNRKFRVLAAQTTRAEVRKALDARIDWLLIRPEEGRLQLIRPDELERALAGDAEIDEEAEIDLMNIPAHRADTFAIDVRASLQEAYDQFESTEAEALIVQRTSRVGNAGATPYGILTPAAVSATYRR
ncbi:chloride channel protein [Salinisphaera sp. Q1T1-3]|uniref:chloride channel protein n=1 Tax=Salinisphaera sp. Q1T1-3 TaxID=2321229 RepID=UPI000E73273F|nr:chloride channel protein [Salinisphaera sp. Q1T1-3]RJS91578.1 chloride channel protein [Salinisphaera sp. Q1T1-3]